MTKLNLFNDYHQLEDRITHGFIATLDTLSPHKTVSFLNQLFKVNDYSTKVLHPDLVFDIQTPSAINHGKFSEAKLGILLRIAQPDAKLNEEDDSKQKDSRPDGWIFDGDTLFLIESKLDDDFRGGQLAKHRDRLEDYCDESEFDEIELTWQQIQNTLENFLDNEDLEDAEEKVANQFLELMYLEGVTMNFEKLYDPNYDDEIRANWESNFPRKTLNLLKSKINKRLQDKEVSSLDFTQEHTKETRTNFYWVRLFSSNKNTETKGAEWRSTAYINPDGISVDFILFRPGQSDLKYFESLFKGWRKALKKSGKSNLARTYLYLTSYGKRRSDAQQGRDYRYAKSEFSLGDQGNVYKSPEEFPIDQLSELIHPKQLGLEYKIYNPRGTYWDKENNQDTINHRDAELLRNPEEVVEKFAEFLSISTDVVFG